MNEVNVKDEDALFDSFFVERPEKGRLFDAFTISSLFFIAFTLVDLAIDANRFSLKPFDWQLAIVILFLPLVGLVFYLTNKKIGWIISFFYYLAISLLALYSFLQNLGEKKNISNGWANWRGNLLLLLVFTSTALLFSKQIRKYFRVSPQLLTITSVTSIGLAILMIFTILEN